MSRGLDDQLLVICQVLRNYEVVNFVKSSITSGYAEVFPAYSEEIDDMVSEAFSILTRSQRKKVSPRKLRTASDKITYLIFKKGDASFWFNKGYRNYKRAVRPEKDFEIIKGFIEGQTVLDFGCGMGYLALKLKRSGYKVFTTDVLDYRAASARVMPFHKMVSVTDIPYSDDSIGTIVVKSVLHHVDAENIPLVLQRLRTVAGTLIIEEDTYRVPDCVENLNELLDSQPLLARFLLMRSECQFQSLVLLDYFANEIALGSLGTPSIHLPFQFKTIPEWKQILGASGLEVSGVILSGFKFGKMHKNCQAWMICHRKSGDLSS